MAARCSYDPLHTVEMKLLWLHRVRLAICVVVVAAVLTGPPDAAWAQSRPDAVKSPITVQDNSPSAIAVKPNSNAPDNGALVRSRFLARMAWGQINKGDYGAALALALEAMPDEKALENNTAQGKYWQEAQASLYAALLRYRKVDLLTRHKRGVRGLAVSPDGRQFVTVSDDLTARLWEARSGAQLRVFKVPPGTHSVMFTPDGKRIVTALSGFSMANLFAEPKNNALIWDVKTGARLAVLDGHQSLIGDMAVTPDGAHIITTSINIRIWDAETGTLQALLKGHFNGTTALAVTPDSSKVVTGGQDNVVRIWDIKSASQVMMLKGHRGAITAIDISRDGLFIATSSRDQTARLWNARTGKQISVFKSYASALLHVALTPDASRIIAAAQNRKIIVWDARTGAQLHVLRGHKGDITKMLLTSDGKRVVSAAADKTVRIWDLATGKQTAIFAGHIFHISDMALLDHDSRLVTTSLDHTVRIWDVNRSANVPARLPVKVLKGPSSYVYSVAVSDDGTQIVSGSRTESDLPQDFPARLWDSRSGEILKTFSAHEISWTKVAISPDGTRIVTGGFQGVRTWNARTGELIWQKKLAGGVKNLAITRDGRRIAAARWHDVDILDGTNGSVLMTLKGHRERMNDVAFSANGTRIVTGSDDKTVRLWDARTGAQLRVFKGHMSGVSAVGMSADGTRIVSGSRSGRFARGGAIVWNAKTGAVIAVLRGHANSISDVAISADGSRVVTGSHDKTAAVWDVRSGAMLAQLSGHSDHISSVAFTRDNKHVITGSLDKTIRIWPIFSNALAAVRQGKALIGRCLTPLQRVVEFHLQARPPAWCLTQRLWPFAALKRNRAASKASPADWKGLGRRYMMFPQDPLFHPGMLFSPDPYIWSRAQK